MPHFENETLNPKRLFLFLLFLIPLAYFSYRSRGFQLDDALIYQRYVRNLFDGYGLVYNQGELFNALTSSLHTYFTIVASFIVGNVHSASIILAAIFMALTLSVFTLVFSRYESIYFVLFGAIFMAVFPYFYLTYGMETPLFIFFIGLCLYFFEKEDNFWLGIACALLLLLRSEGVFLILAMAIEHFRQKRPFPKLSYFILPLLIIGASYSFNKFYYGHFLAETAAAKLTQGQSGLWGEWPAFKYVGYQFGWFFSNSKLLLSGLIVLSFCGVLSLRLKSLNVISISFLFFYTLFFVVFNIPNYHWYYAPYYAFAFFYTGLGIAWLTRNFLSAKDIVFKTMGIVAISVAIPLLLYSSLMVTHSKADIGGTARPYQIIGQWLKDNTPDDAKVALIEIGTVGWYSDRYIIDILGLVNPLNAKFLGERNFSAWLHHYSPDYILIHQPLTGHEVGVKDAVLVGDFMAEQRLQVSGFQLLAKQQDLPTQLLPEQISSPNQISLEKGQSVLLVHAPGEVRFRLSPGKYTLNGQFGILKGAYNADNKNPTDGVDFSAVIKESSGQTLMLFKRFLNPLVIEQDRGVQKITAVPFEIKHDAELVLQTHPGLANRAESDWSFWKAIQIEHR